MVPCADEAASGGAAAPGAAASGETAEDSMQTPAEEPDQSKEKDPSWEHKTVLFFLQECIKRKTDLRNPKIRLENQKVLREEAGVSFSTTTLDTKLKNMKLRYHKILDNNKKTSTGRGRGRSRG
ncbi:uncharacterized protein LOC129906986 [Episyrphus balteatus]|uniref:uncharacterized protein LOC129906986 n=1 Tax=Episyrphus balteatus TaxID=286459 RepID=UPI0024863F1A|nr:uncharacterized protein LOC129906986 [Episyrphus balteatus]